MPNHFANVCVCRQSYEGIAEDAELPNLDALSGVNLCERAFPMPVELRNIVSMGRPTRFRHKQTGEFFNSCNGPLGAEALEFEEVPLGDEEIAELRRKHGGADWYEWSREQWGTKWGTYDTEAFKLAGDDNFILLTFQTAWGPPRPQLMAKIEEYLRKEFNLTHFNWLGCDPYDGSIAEIEVAKPELPHSLEQSLQQIRDIVAIENEQT